MTQQHDSIMEQQQHQKKTAKEQKQDIKNAEYIAQMNRQNHPNT